MARESAAPGETARLRHIDARSCSYGGRVYPADRSGAVTVPVEAVAELASHGFGPADGKKAE